MVGTTKRVLCAEGVRREYNDEDDRVVLALDDFNLTAHEGEMVALVGPSGCGKSTFLRLVAGLDPLTAGKLTYDGEDIVDVSPERGFVFQNNNLFPWLSVRDNIAFPLVSQRTYKAQKHRVQEMVDVMGLTGFEKSYPSQISGGMASRVALAQTFISDPDLILLDEPLSALDAFTRAMIQDEIIRIWQERHPLVLLVTHDIEEAVYMSTRVVVVSHRPGKVIGEVPIGLEFPRVRTAPEFVDLRVKVMDMLGAELELAEEESAAEEG